MLGHSYTLPPYEEPHITVSRTASPVRGGSDVLDVLISGVELIVSKLPRDSMTSAAHHLQALLEKYNGQHPSDPLVPVRISPGDERNPVDYVFVSVDPDITQDPRPDLLEKVRGVLTSVHGLQAEWKIGNGPDRTRRIHFHVDSFALPEALQPNLNDYLNEQGCPFQCSFVSKTMNCITYDLLDRTSVDELLAKPPVIDHQTLVPSIPHYIQPVYGLEVAILGIKDVLGAIPVLDHYIRRKYGNVIASSRLAFNGDAYCVVFKTWVQTLRFLSDPFTAFKSGLDVSHLVAHAAPALLYVLNTNGLLISACPPDSSSAPFRQLQAQVDMLQQKVDTVLLRQPEQLTRQLRDQAYDTANSIAHLSAVTSASARLRAANSRLEALQSDRRAAFAAPDRSDALAQHLHIQQIESDISHQKAAVSRAEDTLSMAERRLLPISTYSSLPRRSNTTSTDSDGCQLM